MSTTDRPFETALRLLLGIVAFAFVVATLAVAAARISYPFPLEWMEGGLVLQTRRILHGRPLYVEPSLAYTPFIYPPLYFYVSAAVAAVVGIGFVPLRLVSVLATLGCYAAIGGLVRRETGSTLPAVVAAGLFAATYPLVGAWFDLARVDMLFLLLALACAALVRFGRGAGPGVAAGVLFALAFLAKQSAVFVLGPLVLYALYHRRQFGVAFAATAGALSGLAVAILTATSDGWFLYYAFLLPTRHEMALDRLVTFWTWDFLPPIVVAATFVAAYLWDELRRGRREVAHFYALVVVAFVGASWQARLHTGGWLNTLIPAYAAVAIVFGLAVDRGLDVAAALGARLRTPTPGHLRSLVTLLVLVQFAALGYAPADHVPSSADRRRAEATEAAIESIDGPVFSPIYPYVALRAGHEPVAHKMALVDVFRASPHGVRADLEADVSRAMRGHRYRALLLHHEEHPLVPLSEGYRLDGPLRNPHPPAAPVTGVEIYPRYVFVPANGTASGNGR